MCVVDRVMAEVKAMKVLNCNLICIFYLTCFLFSHCFSQEFTYFTNPTTEQDLEPETSVEDVAPMEAEPLNQTTTAIAKIYQLPNITENGEPSPRSTKVACLNITRDDSTVEIVNTTGLMSTLYINPGIKERSQESNCTIVMFYARWCPFSANAAPHFNALPRVFPALKSVAIDATVHSSVNTYFGILSVPTVMLFHNGKPVAKYNESTISLSKLVDFITGVTDLEVAEKVNVTSQDFQGPLPSTPAKERDLYLYLAWIFIIICFLNFARKSALLKSTVELIRTTWREAEDQHEHQD